jgi:hypothetical protein
MDYPEDYQRELARLAEESQMNAFRRQAPPKEVR